MKQTASCAMLLLVLLMMLMQLVHGAEPAPPKVLVPCPGEGGSCLTFGFTMGGAGSALAEESQQMANGYILWAETVNTAQGIQTK